MTTSLPSDDDPTRRRQLAALAALPGDMLNEPSTVPDDEWPRTRKSPLSRFDRYLDGRTWRIEHHTYEELRATRAGLHARAKRRDLKVEWHARVETAA